MNVVNDYALCELGDGILCNIEYFEVALVYELYEDLQSQTDRSWYDYKNDDGLERYSVTDNVFVVGFPFGYKTTGQDGWYAIWNNGTIASILLQMLFL